MSDFPQTVWGIRTVVSMFLVIGDAIMALAALMIQASIPTGISLVGAAGDAAAFASVQTHPENEDGGCGL